MKLSRKRSDNISVCCAKSKAKLPSFGRPPTRNRSPSMSGTIKLQLTRNIEASYLTRYCAGVWPGGSRGESDAHEQPTTNETVRHIDITKASNILNIFNRSL